MGRGSAQDQRRLRIAVTSTVDPDELYRHGLERFQSDIEARNHLPLIAEGKTSRFGLFHWMTGVWQEVIFADSPEEALACVPPLLRGESGGFEVIDFVQPCAGNAPVRIYAVSPLASSVPAADDSPARRKRAVTALQNRYGTTSSLAPILRLDDVPRFAAVTRAPARAIDITVHAEGGALAARVLDAVGSPDQALIGVYDLASARSPEGLTVKFLLSVEVDGIAYTCAT